MPERAEPQKRPLTVTPGKVSPVNDEQELEQAQRFLKNPTEKSETLTPSMALYLQHNIGNQALQRLIARSSHPTKTVQRVKYEGTPIDIDTLDADEVAIHIKRFYLLKANKGSDEDKKYDYDNADIGKLKVRAKKLKDDAVALKHTTLVSDLAGELGTLATASDFETAPPWTSSSPGSGKMTETYSGETVTADKDSVVQAWKDFLGPGTYSHKHPRTGADDPTRLVSADGLRSIRYGNHERTSNAQNHHYHEERWSHNSGNNTVEVANLVCRVPVT